MIEFRCRLCGKKFSDFEEVKKHEIEDVTCRNAWFEVILGINYNKYSWSEIGQFLDDLKNNGIRVISLKTDWYGDCGLEEYGLVVKVWIDVRKFLVGVAERGQTDRER